MVHTKIVATLGPGSEEPSTLGRVIEAGVDVARLNFSHGRLEDHARVLGRLREHAKASGSILAVMGDLCGPKIRLGSFGEGDHELQAGDTVVIQRGDCEGTAKRFCVHDATLVDQVDVGHRVLIDDGNISLRVVDKRTDELVCECLSGGALRTRAGVNLPDSDLDVPSLTDADRVALDWAMDNHLDYIALSFVRRPGDVRALRDRLEARGSTMQVVSKIEKPEAISRIDEIIDTSDAVLVARGDLGVEMDVARVPLLQKDITLRARQAGKPVIIATQMLQSMVRSSTPTRAEVSDVANAILDGADAVMLSAETAVGEYPVAAVRVMHRIAEETEAFLAAQPESFAQRASTSVLLVASALARAAARLVHDLGAALVVVWTGHGYTARLLANVRFNRPILGLSSDPAICRQMALLYGVLPMRMEQPEPQAEMLRRVDQVIIDRGLARVNDVIVVVSGTRLATPGATNALLIHRVGA